ncbi:MAG: hypothetical protein MR016_07325 [Agathobacter sp.]|nr:hypothetical protein [Agathobacter sp.]
MRMNRETMVVMICMAVMGAIGVFMLICAVAGIDVYSLGLGAAAGFITGFAGMLFSVLLLSYYNGFRK